jgi:glycosyltransferase involved in cell wall biosynthesis
VKRGRDWLVLTQYYPPEIGAPQIRLRCVTRELRRHGLEPRVLTALPNYPAGKIFPAYQGRFSVRESLDGVPVRRTWVWAATGRSAFVRLANYFSFTATALVAALTGRRPDVLFVESQPLSLGIVALAMKWLRGVPYVYNVPDLQIEVAREMGFLRAEALLSLAQRFEDLLVRHAWRVSTVTDSFQDHFVSRGLPRERVTFLPNGADTEFLRPIPPDPELRSRWGLQDRHVVLYVGTHAYYHGLDTLLEAARQLQSRKDIVFLLVGDGPERARLRRTAEQQGLSNVVFGESPYEEMARLYSIAAVSVAVLRDLPVARRMRLSKIFPSLACEVPVVYSGVGEAADILERQGVGVAVPPESPAPLATAIAALVGDAPRRAAMGKKGRSWVEAEYGWSGIVERWLAGLGPADDNPLEGAVRNLES